MINILLSVYNLSMYVYIYRERERYVYNVEIR